MSAIGIRSELLHATGNWTLAHSERLRQLGVPLGVVWNVSAWVGAGRILPEANGLYQPLPDGRPALIVGEAARDSHGNILYPADLVAFRTTDPHRWWLRRGVIDVLGESRIDLAKLMGTPLMLHETPLSWLRHKATGACIVDWRLHPELVFCGVRLIVCESPRLYARLQRRLQEVCRPRLRITVAEEVRHAA